MVASHLAPDLGHIARKDVAAAVDEGEIVAYGLHAAHVVGGEDDGGPLVAQSQDLVLEELGVDGVEAGERLVEDQKARTVEHRDDKLHLLGHAFGELLHLAPPPVGYAETVKPFPELHGSLPGREALEPGEEEGLVAHLHFLVEATLLRQVAYAEDVVGHQTVVAKPYLAAVGSGDVVDDSDEGRLSGAVRAEQAVDRAFRDADAHVVEGLMIGIPLADMLSAYYVHIKYF